MTPYHIIDDSLLCGPR